MPNIAYINDQWMPLSRAKVSVEDRGFQFGDGVYEVIRTYRGRLFQVDDHLERLERSSVAIGLDPVYSRSRWKTILNKINKKCGYREAKLYIQITRGIAPREHVFPRRPKTTVVVTARRLTPLPPILRRRGAKVITVPDIRWGRCDIKSVNLLPNVMARERASAAGADEAIFVREESVTEGAISNIFAIIGGKLITPCMGPLTLSGITRECVLRLAKDAGFSVMERDLPLKELLTANEAFLTGTTIEVLPVVRIDDQWVGDGKPGEMTGKLFRLFQGFTAQ